MRSHHLHIRIGDASERGRLTEADLQMGKRKHHVYFRCNDLSIAGHAETFVTPALLPCMRKGYNIIVDGSLSPRLLKAMDTIQDIYCAWEPSLHRIQIQDAIPEKRPSPKERRIGTFFSAGVDSFYTFLKHQDEITDLLFIHGFDIKLEDLSLRRRTSEMIRKIASAFGKRVIEVETNVASFLDPYVRWGNLGHGPALASVGHLLAPVFSRIYIPASHTYADLFPWGSHPLLDPLWSTEALEFVHDGCESTRIGKVAMISRSDIALQFLRVCLHPPATRPNCSQCEKCIRTMISLHAFGALNRCTAFNPELDPNRISQLIVFEEDVNTRSFIKENIQALENRQEDGELRHALLRILNPGRPRWQLKAMREVRRVGRQIQSIWG